MRPGPPALDAVWQWFGRMRQGTRYQPLPDADVLAPDIPAPDEASADPNGCVPKLALLRTSGYRFAGARILSLGCNAAYYERHLIADGMTSNAAVRGRRTSVHLVDTDAATLAEALEAVKQAGAARVRTFAGPAERCRLSVAYDVTLFLSLYHHYDRLGGKAREAGRRLLARAGQRSQTMFFETGQSDDTVNGAGPWRDSLEMGATGTVQWLESAVPAIAGYDAWRRLGVNPRTQRALYIYWRNRCAPAAPLLNGAGRDDGPLVVRLDEGGAPLAAAVAAALAGRERRPVLWDCAFTREPVSDAARTAGLAALLEATASLSAHEHAVVVHDPHALRWLPLHVPVMVDIGAGDIAERFGSLATACCAGARVIRVGTDDGDALTSAASAFGARVVQGSLTSGAS